MITNLLEALLKENSNQFSEVFEELMAEKLTVKVEETLQEHFEADAELFELSKKTLGSYTRNAASSMGNAAHDLGQKKAEADEVDRMTNRNMKNKYIAQDSIKKSLEVDDDSQSKLRRTIGKRLKGIDKATARLTKENYEGLDEAVAKIACLKCDAVTTHAAWQKNHGSCPKCKVSTQGVAENYESELVEHTDTYHRSMTDYHLKRASQHEKASEKLTKTNSDNRKRNEHDVASDAHNDAYIAHAQATSNPSSKASEKAHAATMNAEYMSKVAE